MSSSEGGREIQLAKERLASAKARVESASKNFVAAKETKKQIAKAMEVATNGVNTAQLELLSSQSEAKKAEESLKAAEKRREVVNIDSDSDDDTEEGNKKKKRKKGTTEIKPFSANENRAFEQGCTKYGWGNWHQVQTLVYDRTSEECEEYARMILANHPQVKERLDAEHKKIWVNTKQLKFAVGQRVLVWCDKTNDHWKATILGRKEKNGIPGCNIHWEGTKWKSGKSKQDWVPCDDITASEWESHTPAPEFGPEWTKYKIPCKSNKNSYVYYVSPKGERFRSKSEVERYLNNLGST